MKAFATGATALQATALAVALAQPAAAAYDDVGPLSDVVAIRADFERVHGYGGWASMDRVIVRGDWALTTIGGKGSMDVYYHRVRGSWVDQSAPSATHAAQIPKDVQDFFALMVRESGREARL